MGFEWRFLDNGTLKVSFCARRSTFTMRLIIRRFELSHKAYSKANFETATRVLCSLSSSYETAGDAI